MAEEFTLHDGHQGIIWPLLASDRRTMREEYSRLSERSRFNRFLSAVPELTEPMLDTLVGAVDGTDHVALVAFVLPEEGPEQLAGIARIVRYPDQRDAADVAVTILDDWQGQGVGTALLRELMRRRPVGVTRLVTYVNADNRASLALMGRLGNASFTFGGHGRLDVVVELGIDAVGHRSVSPSPSPPSAHRRSTCRAGCTRPRSATTR